MSTTDHEGAPPRVRPTLHLLDGCPFSFKALLFLVESGRIDGVEVVTVKPDSDEYQRVKGRLGTHVPKVTFPTLELEGDRFISDSDGIVARYSAGVDSGALTAFSFYTRTMLPVIENLWTENRELEARSKDHGGAT